MPLSWITPLDPDRTNALLPWEPLLDEISCILQDPLVQVPPRIIMPTAHGGCLFTMPAHDQRIAITKLITFTPQNTQSLRPTIQGDVVVFDVATGERRLILDGPSITGRRTAAVSAFAARLLAPNPQGPLLIIGAGAQGLAHAQAFSNVLGTREIHIASRSPHSAKQLAAWVTRQGLQAHIVTDIQVAAQHCPLIVTATPANGVVLRGPLRDDCFVAAVGAFTPQMHELDADLCRHFDQHGRIVIDTPDAWHEAGDLLQAGLAVQSYATLAQIVNSTVPPAAGPVLFKSCGWGGWDLAAARLAFRLACAPRN